MLSPTVTSLNQLMEQSAWAFGNQPAVGFAFQPAMSYADFHAKIRLVAALLKDLGIRKNDRVAILADNSPQWGVAYLGVVRLGAVAVPILPDFSEPDVKHILTESGARMLFTAQRQLEKLYDLKNRKLKTIVTLDDAADPNGILAPIPFTEFLARAEALPERLRTAANNQVREEDLASIIYTSGTSGHSKAVMLSHGNFLSNVRSTLSIFAEETIRGWSFLSVLPMSHAYEFTISFLVPLATGSRIIYAGKTPTPTILERICREEQPTLMCMVPMVMEKIYKKKILPAISGNPLIRTALRLPVIRGRILRKIGRELHRFFGGKLKFIAIGGAALNIEVEKFLAESGFPYLVGYGLTEASPLVSAGPYKDSTIAVGSAGKPVPGVEVRIVGASPETGLGEILVRGANVMKGYCDNPRATAETIDQDGWLATGDLGYLDKYGNLFIKGRSKSVIVLSHGENIYPEAIEEKINAFQHVVESLVVERNDRLEAQIYLDYELIDAETRGKGQTRQLAHIEEILTAIKKQVNAQLPAYSQLAGVVEHREPFTKTATHKIKRYLYTSAK
ncbi:AMP-binding protein [Thiovibrio sp. JS02]